MISSIRTPDHTFDLRESKAGRPWKTELLILTTAFLLTACAEMGTVDLQHLKPVGDCIAGDCSQGQGTRRYPDGSEISGWFQNGKTIAGTYQIRSACKPGETFTLRMNGEGQPIEGTMPRCGGLLSMLGNGSRPSLFTGTWKTTQNPFTGHSQSTYQTGLFTDADGKQWEGEFDYIPVHETYQDSSWGETSVQKGSYILLGVRIDKAENEVVSGLFISSPVTPGEEINFTRARPSYLIGLQEKYVAQMNKNEADKAAAAKTSREFFSDMVNIARVAVDAYGTYKIAEASQRSNLDNITGVVTGKKNPQEASKTISSQNKSTPSTPPSVTVSEYQKYKSSSQGEMTNLPPLNVPSADHASQKKYNYIAVGYRRGVGKTESEGCKSAEKSETEVLNDIKRIVKTEPCSCYKNSNFYGTIYECKIPVTVEISSNYNPDSKAGPSTGVSR